jgi:hypothetical protein
MPLTHQYRNLPLPTLYPICLASRQPVQASRLRSPATGRLTFPRVTPLGKQCNLGLSLAPHNP